VSRVIPANVFDVQARGSERSARPPFNPERRSVLSTDPFALPGDELAAADADWLALPDDKAPPTDWLAVPGIETQKFAARYDALRFEVMKGSSRVWACDGEYVACRPNAFHDATRTRHQKFLRSGHYEHVGTFDDVQVFKLLEGSPFRRDVIDIRTASWYECMRGAAVAACNRDWSLYHDVLDEIATRLKSTPTGTASGDGFIDPVISRERWEFALDQIGQMIYMRGGPTRAEVDAGFQNVRRARGIGQGRLIALPTQTRRIQ
jgi:hypothetical protein